MADVTKLRPEQQAAVDAFHKLYYPFFGDTRWLGLPTAKCPMDLFVYQEMIFELQPDLIIEGGTFAGGSAVFMASVCQLVGHGEVLTIDVEGKPNPEARPQFPRVTYLQGDILSPEVVSRVARLAQGRERVMVIFDDDHTRDHVLAEMKLYSRFVTPGSYLVIEDTNVNGHPVVPEFGPGPMEAVDLFLRENDDFVIDRSREKFLLSFNPKGFLRRLQPQESSYKKDVIISQQREELFDLRRQVEALQQQAGKAEETLDGIFNSTSWKFLQRWRSARNLFLPEGSVRRKIYRRTLEKFR